MGYRTLKKKKRFRGSEGPPRTQKPRRSVPFLRSGRKKRISARPNLGLGEKGKLVAKGRPWVMGVMWRKKLGRPFWKGSGEPGQKGETAVRKKTCTTLCAKKEEEGIFLGPMGTPLRMGPQKGKG